MQNLILLQLYAELEQAETNLGAALLSGDVGEIQRWENHVVVIEGFIAMQLFAMNTS